MPVSLPSALYVFVLLATAAPLCAQETAEASPPSEPSRSEQPPPSEQARALFLANCATCHGETGDGQGTTQLDRPARSFMDGGFSFGNTPEALFRTISVGIPGTPMPGFEASLSEEQRNELARYVVTLGPPVEETTVEDMLLAVHDRPVIVRGLLPPLADGLPSHPRGLLIGYPSGITFEYQVDDVRLLAMRQGNFVERTDWNGRGGTPLKPLGVVVHLVEAGKPEASFFHESRALVARLSSTRVAQGGGAISYHLLDTNNEIAHVEEVPVVRSQSFGTGFSRELRLQPVAVGHDIMVRTPAFEGARLLASGKRYDEIWQVVQPTTGQPVYVEIWASSLRGFVRRENTGQIDVALALENGKHAGVQIWNLVLTGWDDTVRNGIERWSVDR